jgi:hypothetical protein
LCKPEEQGRSTCRRRAVQSDGEYEMDRCRDAEQSNRSSGGNSHRKQVRRSDAITSRRKGKVESG